jgi:hypothetical protein
MGIIITDGITAIKFKGPISDFEKLVVSLGKLQRKFGPKSLMIDTVPVPESPGIVLALRFRGSTLDFEKLVAGMEQIKSTIAIDTVPLPEMPKIGTWPTPEIPRNILRFTVWVRSDTK